MGDVAPVHLALKVDTVDASIGRVESTLESAGVCRDGDDPPSRSDYFASGFDSAGVEDDHVYDKNEYSLRRLSHDLPWGSCPTVIFLPLAYEPG